MKKPIAIWTAVLLVVGLSVAAYFFWPSPRDRTPTVRIGYLNIVASLPLFIADEKGLLRQQGVQYELIPFATSNQLVDAIVAHNIDCFVESSAVPVLAAELRAPGYMKIFAASEITESAPFDAIIVSNSSPIRDLSGLDGKNVGVFPGSTATKLLQAFLREKGIASDTVTFSPIPPKISSPPCPREPLMHFMRTNPRLQSRWRKGTSVESTGQYTPKCFPPIRRSCSRFDDLCAGATRACQADN
jgi:ABC-type nitrate/sulfonate/bicarbonate transport system substrate-binding protein